MSAPLDAFVAGNYYCFYTSPIVNPISVQNTPIYQTTDGIIFTAGVPTWIGSTARGFTLSTTMEAELVTGTDIWSKSIVEVIYCGGNMFLHWDAIAFKYGALAPYWPWSQLGYLGQMGRLGTIYSGSVVMVAAPGTTASNTPNVGQIQLLSLTAPNAILVEGQNQALVFDARLRRIPAALRLLPYKLKTSPYDPPIKTPPYDPPYDPPIPPIPPFVPPGDDPEIPPPGNNQNTGGNNQNTGGNILGVTLAPSGTGASISSSSSLIIYKWYDIL